MATPGDALGDSKTMGSSPADMYYRWKLMADKYAVAADERLSDTAKNVLGATKKRLLSLRFWLSWSLTVNQALSTPRAKNIQGPMINLNRRRSWRN